MTQLHFLASEQQTHCRLPTAAPFRQTPRCFARALRPRATVTKGRTRRAARIEPRSRRSDRSRWRALHLRIDPLHHSPTHPRGTFATEAQQSRCLTWNVNARTTSWWDPWFVAMPLAPLGGRRLRSAGASRTAPTVQCLPHISDTCNCCRKRCQRRLRQPPLPPFLRFSSSVAFRLTKRNIDIV